MPTYFKDYQAKDGNTRRAFDNILTASAVTRNANRDLNDAYVNNQLSEEDYIAAIRNPGSDLGRRYNVVPVDDGTGPKINYGSGYVSYTPTGKNDGSGPGLVPGAAPGAPGGPSLPTFGPLRTASAGAPSPNPAPFTPVAPNPADLAAANKAAVSGTPAPAPAADPNVKNNIDKFLSDISLGKLGTSGGPEVRGSASLIDRLNSILNPAPSTTPAPTSLVDTYNNLRQSQGVTALEGNLADVNARLAAFQNDLTSKKYALKGAPVSSRFINGAIAHLDAESADALNKLEAEKQTIVNQLDNKNTAVNTLMKLTQDDYTNAQNRQEKEYDRALKLYGLLKDQNSQENALRDDARANITVIQNALKDKPSFQLTDEMKTQFSKLETQAGLPQGFIMGFAQAKPGAKVLFHTTDNGVTQVFYEDQNQPGRVGQVETFGGGGGGPTQPKFTGTQLNKGAAVAGIPFADFNNLDPESKNYFINRSADVEKVYKAIEQAKADKEDPSDFEAEIAGSSAPPGVKDSLDRYLKTVFKDQYTEKAKVGEKPWWEFWK